MGPKGIEESLSRPYTIPKVTHKDLTFLETGKRQQAVFSPKLFLSPMESEGRFKVHGCTATSSPPPSLICITSLAIVTIYINHQFQLSKNPPVSSYS
jgi:hypothetical protein